MKGFVYIFTNKSHPEIVKIGYTAGDPKDRAAKLSGTALLYPHKFYGCVEVENPAKVEKLVHKKLSKYRVSKGREFFKIEPKDALATLEEVSGELEYFYSKKKEKELESIKLRTLFAHIFCCLINTENYSLGDKESKKKIERDFNEVRKLVDEGVSINEKYNPVLDKENTDEFNEEEKYKDLTPLEIAVGKDYKLTKYLISKGAKLDTNKGPSLIFRALSSPDSKRTIKLLISKGADIDGKIWEGKEIFYRPLHQVIINGERGNKTKSVETLLLLGADPNSLSYEYSTPLRTVLGFSNIDSEKLELLEILVYKGANINALCGKRTPQSILHHAVFREWPEVVDLLITNGANVNIVGYRDQTALDYMEGKYGFGLPSFIRIFKSRYAYPRAVETYNILKKHGAKRSKDL